MQQLVGSNSTDSESSATRQATSADIESLTSNHQEDVDKLKVNIISKKEKHSPPLRQRDTKSNSTFDYEFELFPWEIQSIAYPVSKNELYTNNPNLKGSTLNTLSLEIKNETKSPEMVMSNTNFADNKGGQCVHPWAMEKGKHGGSCCLGSISTGGAGVSFTPAACQIGKKPYNDVRDHALLELEKTDHILTAHKTCDVCQLAKIITEESLSMAFVGLDWLSSFPGLRVRIS